ncbi:hypothetical protein Plec18170_008344 [Paecilomyces lecythidis]
MDMQHHLLKTIHGGRIFFAPIDDPARILDIGTGSGIWPIEMGTYNPSYGHIVCVCVEIFVNPFMFLDINQLRPSASIFPGAHITGTDLSPVQPTEVPENVHFLVDDATERDWLWNPNHFDLIHTAMMTGSLPSFKDVMRKAFIHLKPGGYLECHEVDPKPLCDDGTMPPENPEGHSEYAFHDWFDYNERSSRLSDPPRQFRIAHRLARWMRETGFVDVQERIDKIPLNPWPADPEQRKIGTWWEANWLDALSAWSYKPFLALGWSKPEIEVFLVDVRRSIQNTNVHGYNNFYVVTGRKPLPEERQQQQQQQPQQQQQQRS